MNKLDRINKQLRDEFGIDITGRERYRVVWANDQFENRLTAVTEHGVQLLHPEIRYMPKYLPWLKDLYLVERLTEVPNQNSKEMLGLKLSYEPFFPFADKDGNPLPPNFEAARFVINNALEKVGKPIKPEWAKDDPNAPITSQQELNEHRKKEIDDLEMKIFGNQSGLKQAIVGGSGIAVPSNYGEK